MIELWESVSWAEHNAEDLGNAQGEVDQLRDEKHHHCLREVTKDSHYCKSHASTITESVTNEDFRWESVVLEKGERASYKGNHESKGEHMVLYCLSGFLSIKLLVNVDFNDVVDNDKAPNNDRLTNFDTINSRINIDSISTEDGDISHINIV